MEIMNEDSILDAFPDQTAIINKYGIITQTNRAWKIFSAENGGHPSFDDIGVNYLQVLKQAKSLIEFNGINEVLNGELDSFSNRYPCHSPEVDRWFLMYVTPLFNQEKIVGALVAHRNITEEEWSKNQTVDILESMNDAFFTLDQYWCFTYINKEAEILLERNRNDLVGKHIWTEFPDEKGSRFQLEYEATAISKSASRFEEKYIALNKWFDVHVYPRAQNGLAVFFQDITDKKNKDKQLWNLANYDELTGLANRRMLYDHINQKINAKKPFSLLFIDLNDFKMINDVFGHDAGDNVLMTIGQRLKKYSMEEAIISRLGGDEFVLIIETVENKNVIEFVNRLLREIRQSIYVDGYSVFQITASIGISSYPEIGSNISNLMSSADTAMYEAKKTPSSNGAFCFYEIKMHEVLKRKMLLGQDMFQALDRGEFFFVFQPQINLHDQNIVGVEVLSRWNHPDFGYISPPEFIRIAEETGKIQELTEKMIENVLTRVQNWRECHQFEGSVAFNISSSLLESHSFFLFIHEQMKKFKIGWGKLELEITETLHLISSQDMFYQLERLRELGVIISIDDFGTGYSKINYLSNLPIDKIKVDKSFIDAIGEGTKKEAVLHALIVLIKSLELDVIAEGVETIEQEDELLRHGCHYVQGYLYSKPLEESDLLNYIRHFYLTKKQQT
ncbi:EAL domain-containing protein [Bacillus sp. FJAT-45037]|uniref:EAL domain-containing protein n=1 Tax=Bacillus sp. FJAT-45037 TaxID=2011007 RepID=UPI0018E24008|nr:EAL domain-containing protein [Bacillus sp. FJAT-45037]